MIKMLLTGLIITTYINAEMCIYYGEKMAMSSEKIRMMYKDPSMKLETKMEIKTYKRYYIEAVVTCSHELGEDSTTVKNLKYVNEQMKKAGVI